jgi:hypothetical protein
MRSQLSATPRSTRHLPISNDNDLINIMSESKLISEAQDEALKQVIVQFTKNLIDGTMTLQQYKLQLEKTLVRIRSVRMDQEDKTSG